MKLTTSGVRALAIAIGSTALIACAISQDFVRGRTIVKFKAAISESRKNAALLSVNARSTRPLGSGLTLVELPTISNEQAASAKLRSFSDVEFAELDSLYKPAGNPNDPWVTAEWYLNKIDAPGAWAYNVSGANVIIAVLDSGVELNHPDLAANMVPGYNTFDNNSNAWDVYGHGTAVAGVASSVTNNGIGVASLAWNSKIMPIRVTGSNGYASLSAIASGLNWAADRGARVANISFEVSDSATVRSAAQNFYNRGGIVTIAAGNDGRTSTSADNPFALTVSATDGLDSLYSWSNRGSNIDVAAPGSVHTTGLNGIYGGGAGTSFSAPVVASLAALVISQNPSLTASQVMTIIESSADDLGSPGWDSSFGHGRLNARRAIEMAIGGGGGTDSQAPAVSVASPSNGATVSGSVTVAANASDNVGVTSVAFYIDDVLVATDYSAPYSMSWNTTTCTNGSHTLKAVAKDAAGNSAASSSSVTVSNNAVDNQPPTVAITSPTAGARVSTNVSVYSLALDNVRVSKVELYVNGILTATSTASPYTTKWNTKRAARGNHSLQLRATDPSGNASWSETVIVSK